VSWLVDRQSIERNCLQRKIICVVSVYLLFTVHVFFFAVIPELSKPKSVTCEGRYMPGKEL